MSHSDFVGTWKLISSEVHAGDHVAYPLGEDCKGILSFDERGTISAQMMNPSRSSFVGNDVLRGTPAEMQEAYQGYFALWGTYEVDESRGTMTYNVDGSLFPNWVGGSQERRYSIEGDRLTLKTPPITVSGNEVIGVLEWERVS